MSFIERKTLPTANNKYYTKKDKNGYNPCILGNNKIIKRPWENSVLPNCVGWATGRFNEIIGQNNCKYLGNTNAENYLSLAKQQGLTIGQIPKVGACIVWQGGTTLKGGDGCGHVAIVEEVLSDTEIIVSQSGWSSKKAFWTAKHSKGTSGNWVDGDDYSWQKTNYKFLGFIYNPAVAESESMIIKDLPISIYNTILSVKAIVYNNENYVRLRDFEEVLHLCGIGYYNNQVTINGKPQNLNNLKIINKSSTNYVRLKDFEEKLNLITIGYDSIKKLPIISVR